MSVFLGSAYAELNLDLGKFRQGIKDAKSDLKVFGADIDSVASGLQSAGKSIEGAGKNLTKTVTAPIVGLGAAAIKTTADFDSSMSQVYATMGEKAQQMVEYNGKTVSSMEALRDFAQEMGATTKFTASQAADALNYMALAGYDAQTSMAMLPNVLNLAAAGNMDLATASDMVTDTQTAFGISLDRTTQMVDEMAKAASTGNTSVEQLGDAFLVVGGLLQETNGGFVDLADGSRVAVDNVQEMEIALTAMANAGVKGSEAGTHMRNMLLKLASPMDEGYKAFQRLGVSVFDTEGNMRSLNDIFTDLNASFENLTQEEKLNAISAIFNTRDTAAAEALLKAVGEDWNAIGESILNAEGAAQTMADTQLNNLNGQITILKSGIEGLLIQIGDMMMPYLMKITERIQNLVTYLISLDEQQKQQIAKWLAIAAAIGPILIIIGKITSGIGGLIGTFAKFVPQVVGLAKGFGLISAEATGMTAFTSALGAFASAAAPILAVVAAVTALAVGLKKLYDRGGEFKTSVDELVGVLRNDFVAVIEYIKDLFEPLVETIKGGIETIKEAIDIEAIDSAMGNVTDAISGFLAVIEQIVSAIGELLKPALDAIVFVLQGMIAIIAQVIASIMAALPSVIAMVGDIVNIVTDLFNIITGLITGLITGDFTQLGEAVSKLWEDIKSFISDGIDAVVALITEFFGGIWEHITEFFSNVWENIVTFFTDLPYNLGFWLGELIANYILWKAEMKENIVQFFKDAWDNVKQFFKDIKTTVTTKIPEVWNSCKTAVKNFPENFKTWLKNFPTAVKNKVEDMKQAGKDLMNGWWNGLKEIWNSIESWFEGIVQKVKDFLQGIKDGMASAASAAGSHAGGLSYVPYDGYIAQLHEGERVLTRNETEELESGHMGSGGGNTFIFNSPKALDPYESNKLFTQTMREMEEGFT